MSNDSGMPRRGDFGWQPLVSSFEPTLDDMMSDRSYFGMPPEALYLWGTFRDENGDLYSPMRRIPAGLPGDAQDSRRYFYLCTTRDHDEPGMLVHPVGKRSAPNNGFTKTLEGDTDSLAQRSCAARQSVPRDLDARRLLMGRGRRDGHPGQAAQARNALVFARA